jgi:hypothetical protein
MLTSKLRMDSDILRPKLSIPREDKEGEYIPATKS